MNLMLKDWHIQKKKNNERTKQHSLTVMMGCKQHQNVCTFYSFYKEIKAEKCKI